MQICDATVRLAGSVQHTVPKAGVTPAEIQLLKHIHGPDAVIDIRPVKNEKRADIAEWDRLAGIYDAAAAMPAPGDERISLMERLFGGRGLRKMPQKLDDIGMGVAAEEVAAERELETAGGDDVQA